MKYDVAVVGSGLVGKALALLLAQETHYQVVLFDQTEVSVHKQSVPMAQMRYQDAAFTQSPWAVSALSLSSRAILQKLGLWAQLVQMGICPFAGMEITEALGAGQLSFSTSDLNENCLGYLVYNDLLADLMQKAIEQHECITQYQRHRLQNIRMRADRVDLSFDRGQYSARLLVGADGKHSRVRELLGISVTGGRYEQDALVCQIKTQRPHEWVARQVFLEQGPIAFLPLTARDGFDPMWQESWPRACASEQYSSIVWSLPQNQARDLMGLSCEAFKRALAAHVPTALGSLEHCSKLAKWPLYGQSANNCVYRHAVLVGDSAQVLHPLAGQGLNIGLMDAAVLVDLLSESQQEIGLVHSELFLSRYRRVRKLHQKSLLAVTHGLHVLYRQRDWWLILGRNLGLNWAHRCRPLKRFLVKQASAHRDYLPKSFWPYHQQWPF